MKLSLSLVLSAVLAAPLIGQQFPPIPGFNIGLNPIATMGTIPLGPSVGIYMLLPGNATNPVSSGFATFHDPAYLPAGTLKVRLGLFAAWVYDSRSCSPGAGVFFDTQSSRSTFPQATTGAPGWTSVPPNGWTFAFGTDPFYSTWFAGYCSMMSCTSPCGPNVIQPEWMLYVFVPTFT